MSEPNLNKYRAALEVLQRGRDQLVDSLAEDILDQGEDLLDNTYLFNEMIEGQGTKLHFLSMLVAQLEQSAEALDEVRAAAEEPPPAPTPRKRKPRAKKLPQQTSREGKTDEA